LRSGGPRTAVTALALALTAAFIVACVASVGLIDRDLFDAAAVVRMASYARTLIAPELDPAYLVTLLRPAAQTLGMSVIGTSLGVGLGVALGIPATAAHAEDDHSRGIARLARAALRRLSRASLSLLRAVPEVLWALIFVVGVGLGPFAGALALGAHTGGVLGKLYADTLEEVSPLALRGLRATGAGPLHLLVWGAWPEARRMLISYTVLRWETNVRTSTVLGIAGGGGIGIALYNAVQLGFYPQAATLIGVIYLMVAATGRLGDAVRRRLESASLHGGRP
jgi:phosphonate transport system permease protein